MSHNEIKITHSWHSWIWSIGFSLCLCTQSNTASPSGTVPQTMTRTWNSQLGQSSTVPQKFPSLQLAFVSKDVVSCRLALGLSSSKSSLGCCTCCVKIFWFSASCGNPPPRVLEGQTNCSMDTLTKFMTAVRHESRRSSRPLALKPSPATRVQSYINSCQEHSTQSGGLRSSCRGPSRTLGGGCRPTKISAALDLHDTFKHAHHIFPHAQSQTE